MLAYKRQYDTVRGERWKEATAFSDFYLEHSFVTGQPWNSSRPDISANLGNSTVGITPWSMWSLISADNALTLPAAWNPLEKELNCMHLLKHKIILSKPTVLSTHRKQIWYVDTRLRRCVGKQHHAIINDETRHENSALVQFSSELAYKIAGHLMSRRR